MKIAFVAAAAVFFAGGAAAAGPYARIATTKGDIVIELHAEKAPRTVANFLDYAAQGHYDRTLVHRVVPGFVVQGGG